MNARNMVVEALAEVGAEGVERAKHARELSVAEMEEVGGGRTLKSAIIVFDYEGVALKV